MAVKFHKMHGAGNDFVLLDLRQQSMTPDADVARSLADRRTGIGCDQLLVLRAPQTGKHQVAFEVWNADGSRAEQCGNGVRCIALYLQRQGEAHPGVMRFEGPAGIVQAECLADGLVRVDMGRPDFRPERVPVKLPAQDGWYALEVDGQALRVGAVSMGNPHAVLPVTVAETAPVARLGPAISGHAGFPQGCNAGFAEVIDAATLRLRVFERGAGETRACGSGACAAVVVLSRRGLVDKEVRVIQDGGELIIGWNGEDTPVMMTGPAVHVFEGTLE